MINPRVQFFGLMSLAAALFFINTWGYDLWPADEPRFGEVPREMMQSGDYLVPHCNGVPYKEKPPLLFWAIALVSLPLGDVTEFTARVPSGLAALFTVAMTFLLASRLFDRRTAVWSALVLMTMNFFWSEARSVRTDMLLTACMTGALMAFWRWHDSRRAGWLVAFYAAVTLGLYTKGPAALVFPLLLIFCFYWRRKEERRATHWIVGTAVAMGLALAWFLPARMMIPADTAQAAQESVGGEAFRQIIGRVFLGVSKAQPPWYYVINIPLGMLPWTLFLPWALPVRRDSEAKRLLFAWIVPALVFFSISVGKRGVYLLPIYPALAIVTAQGVLELMDSDRTAWRKRLTAIWGIALLVVGAAPLALPFTKYRDLWSMTFIPFVVFALLFAAIVLYRAVTVDPRALHRAMTAHVSVLAMLAAMFFYPAVDTFKGASDFCRPLRELALAGKEYRLFSVSFSREEYVFYSRHFHSPVLTNDPIPLDLPAGLDTKNDARTQRKIRDSIDKAVDKITLASLASPTEKEVETLDTAVRGAIEKASPAPLYAQVFLDAFAAKSQQFVDDFSQGTAAFAFIQEDDWKWLLPFVMHPDRVHVVASEPVGTRSMLLIANNAAVGMLGELKR